jgi:hypothetical protein
MRRLLAGDSYLENRELTLPGGQKTRTKGYIETTVQVAGVTAQVRLLIVNGLGIPVLLGTDLMTKLGLEISFPRKLVSNHKGNIPFWPLSIKDRESHRDKMCTISVVIYLDKENNQSIIDYGVQEFPREHLIDENYFQTVPSQKGNHLNKTFLPYTCLNLVYNIDSNEDITNLRKGEGECEKVREREKIKDKGKDKEVQEDEGKIVEEKVNKFLTEIKEKISKNKRGVIALKGLKPQDREEIIINLYNKINTVDHPKVQETQKKEILNLLVKNIDVFGMSLKKA